MPPTTRATPDDEAAAVIAALDMQPHPEGGHYVETWRGPAGADGRAVGTAIYFLLRAGERSHWHRVDASEVWMYHSGAPLELSIAATAATPPSGAGGGERSGPLAPIVTRLLGADIAAGQHPQLVVPPDAWQAASSTGAWSLVSCVVTPGFEFTGFELAPPNWVPH